MVLLSAHLAAWTDYPDDDIDALGFEQLEKSLRDTKQECEVLLSTFDTARIVSEGVDTAIVGRTNVGKSSLMNLICGEEKSRDVVETAVRMGNAVLKLSDTAGLRESEDKVEQIGIELSRKKVSSASFILAVFDCSKPLEEEDFALLEAIKNKRAILVMNKSDLSAVWEPAILEQYGKTVVSLSAKAGEGYQSLVGAVEQTLGTKEFNPYAPMLATERQKVCLSAALTCINEALDAIHMGLTLDAVNVSIDSAIGSLLELTGERATEKITEEIFKNFCVGK